MIEGYDGLESWRIKSIYLVSIAVIIAANNPTINPPMATTKNAAVPEIVVDIRRLNDYFIDVTDKVILIIKGKDHQ